jgi:glutamate formiminotransferase/formiminotetrahydrofolate cyclodeaminase
MKLIECVPNFSEGRDKRKIKTIASEIENTPGVKLLDIHSGKTTNRTVITFIGNPKSVKEAAFKAIRKALELIDMRFHKGIHPRIGAVDVCPFIPLTEATIEECIQIARDLGKKVGQELEIPVYLYEKAAIYEERKDLENIRRGEYEGLQQKLKDPQWAPDFGPSKFNPRGGAIIIGARDFLIAYNVNLNTEKKEIAHKIALNIRESGRYKRNRKGKILRNEKNKPIRLPGKLKFVKAIGWYINEYKKAQVSVNLINYKQTPLHIVFEEIKKEAKDLGIEVTGSEIIGLVPKEAILAAGKFYLSQKGKVININDERLIIQTAIEYLGLNDTLPFIPEKKIIEYQLNLEKINLKNIRMMKKNQLITGKPGCGKTTLIKKIIELFPNKVAGFYTEEIREKGKRRGFKIYALFGEESIFADININSPFRVGKYGVNIEVFDNIGVKALKRAIGTSKVIIIDEIGKMELFSENFKKVLIKALSSKQKVLATITLSNLEFIRKIKERNDCDVIFLERGNFNSILNRIKKWMSY